MSQFMLTLRADLTAAMRSKDVTVRETLRMVIAACKMLAADKEAVTDDDVVTVLLREKKLRTESLEPYRHAGREDIVNQVLAEIAVIERYLPQQLSNVEVERHVTAAIEQVGAADIRDMGKVMAALGTTLKGQADLKEVSRLVKIQLTGAA